MADFPKSLLFKKSLIDINCLIKKWQNQHLKTLADVRALHCKKSWKNRWTNTLKIVFDRGGGLFLMCGKTSAAWELIDFFFVKSQLGSIFWPFLGPNCQSILVINSRHFSAIVCESSTRSLESFANFPPLKISQGWCWLGPDLFL